VQGKGSVRIGRRIILRHEGKGKLAKKSGMFNSEKQKKKKRLKGKEKR